MNGARARTRPMKRPIRIVLPPWRSKYASTWAKRSGVIRTSRPVAEDEVPPEPAAEQEAHRVAGPGAEPDDRDRQLDRVLALAGDRAAEDHRRLAGEDEADEGAGLEEGEQADQQVGPARRGRRRGPRASPRGRGSSQLLKAMKPPPKRRRSAPAAGSSRRAPADRRPVARQDYPSRCGVETIAFA